MSFPWIRDGVLYLAGGVKTEKKAKPYPLDKLPADTNAVHKKVDLVWEKVRTQYARHNTSSVIINMPEKPDAPIYTCTDMHHGRWRVAYFDQQTLSILSSSEPDIDEAPASSWIRRSNCALHYRRYRWRHYQNTVLFGLHYLHQPAHNRFLHMVG